MSTAMGKGARTKPFTLGGPALIVAVDDEDLAALEPALREVLGDRGVPVEVVPASALANPHAEADFYFGRYHPTEPGAVRIFQTAACEIFEQAPDGRILRDGRQVWPEPPVATGRPTANVAGALVQGESAALCFWTSNRLRVTVTGPLLVLWRQPVLCEGTAPPGWLDLARRGTAPETRPS